MLATNYETKGLMERGRPTWIDAITYNVNLSLKKYNLLRGSRLFLPERAKINLLYEYVIDQSSAAGMSGLRIVLDLAVESQVTVSSVFSPL